MKLAVYFVNLPGLNLKNMNVVKTMRTHIGNWHSKQSFPVVVRGGQCLRLFELFVYSAHFIGDFVCAVDVSVRRHSRHNHLQKRNLKMFSENLPPSNFFKPNNLSALCCLRRSLAWCFCASKCSIKLSLCVTYGQGVEFIVEVSLIRDLQFVESLLVLLQLSFCQFHLLLDFVRPTNRAPPDAQKKIVKHIRIKQIFALPYLLEFETIDALFFHYLALKSSADRL